MKTDYANVPTPTLFKLFVTEDDGVPAPEVKRFVRRVCEAVGASAGLTVRFKTDELAGQTVQDGTVVSVPGFSVYAEASLEDGSTSKQAIMDTWWTPEGYATVGVNRVMKQKAHAPGYEIAYNASIEGFITETLGREFVTPEAWTKRDEQAEVREAAKAEVLARREARDAAKAQKALEAAQAAAAKVGVTVTVTSAQGEEQLAEAA